MYVLVLVPVPQVRPGGLTKDSVRGVSALEINQGDFIIGEVGRADLAKTVVAALETDDTNNVTFELFETGRRYVIWMDGWMVLREGMLWWSIR